MAIATIFLLKCDNMRVKFEFDKMRGLSHETTLPCIVNIGTLNQLSNQAMFLACTCKGGNRLKEKGLARRAQRSTLDTHLYHPHVQASSSPGSPREEQSQGGHQTKHQAEGHCGVVVWVNC
eukprot:1158561-Pelagomonas_calceolata.AAC.8